MALCLAESLIECRGFNPIDQATRYLKWYQVIQSDGNTLIKKIIIIIGRTFVINWRMF